MSGPFDSLPRHRLRPLERRVLDMLDAGMDEVEIALRFRRSPRFIMQVATLARHPGREGPEERDEVLRPLERRVLRWRSRGASHPDIARRFRRSPDHIRRVEGLAYYKLGLRLVRDPEAARITEGGLLD